MSDDNWVLDASMSRPGEGTFCWCPIQGDIDGDFTVVTGMNLLAFLPPGKCVAIVHEDGQEAVDKWCEEHSEVLERLGSAIQERDSH